MKSHTHYFKENIKNLGRELDSKITFSQNGDEIELSGEDLNSITPRYEGAILKSVMKGLEIDSNVEIPVGTELNYKFGVKRPINKNLFNLKKSNAFSQGSGVTVIKANDYVKLTISNTSWLAGFYVSLLMFDFSNYLGEKITISYDKSVNRTRVNSQMAIGTCKSNGNDRSTFFTSSANETTFTVTLPSEISNNNNYLYINLYCNESTKTIGDNITYSNIQIELGETATDYEENLDFDYIDFGNYIVKDVEKQEDSRSYKINCYDIMLKSMVSYQKLEVTYPITIRNYLIALCNYLDIDFANSTDTFANYNKEIPNELFLNTQGESLGYTFRDVLDQLAEVTASIICINNNNELEIRYLNNTNDTIDEEYLKNVNVNFGEKFGPVNVIVLSRSAGSDNIYYPSNIPSNPIEIKIEDNQIMNFNNRDEFLPDIYNKLNGLEYYINDFVSTGVCYYEVGDKYYVNIDENTYLCVMFNDEINITQGLVENIYTDQQERTNTDYTKADRTDRKINQTYIIADKQQGQIEALTSRTTTLEDKANNTYTIEQVNTLIQNAEEGVTNTFSVAGGNNIFRNTGLWFENDDYNNPNPFEFWNGNVEKYKESKSLSVNALLLQNGSVSQSQYCPNGMYTISFKYKKLIELATCKVIINDVEYGLTETDDSDFQVTIDVKSGIIKVEFISDTNNSCEIYDLMVNSGDIKLGYSQNQNESTSDTVNISKGITIKATGIDTIFKANADGTRILDKNGNEITEFTDTGIVTKKIEAEDNSQISGLLIKKVGNHVWMVKI